MNSAIKYLFEELMKVQITESLADSANTRPSTRTFTITLHPSTERVNNGNVSRPNATLGWKIYTQL